MKPVDNQSSAGNSDVQDFEQEASERQVIRVLLTGDEEDDEPDEEEGSTRLEPEVIKHKLRSKDIDAFKALEQEGAEQVKAKLDNPDEDWVSGHQRISWADPSRWLFVGGLTILAVVLASAYFRSSNRSTELAEEEFLNEINRNTALAADPASDIEIYERLRALASRYVAADSWEERLPMMRISEGLLERIRRFEEEHELSLIARELDSFQKVAIADSLINKRVLSFVVQDDEGNRTLMYFVEEEEGWKVDWDASLGVQGVDFDQLGSEDIGKHVITRFWLEFDNLYLEEFPEEEYGSIKLFFPRREVGIYGFIKKGTSEGEWVLANGKQSQRDGERLFVLAELELKQKVAGRWVVEMTRLINNNWVAPDGMSVGMVGDGYVD